MLNTYIQVVLSTLFLLSAVTGFAMDFSLNENHPIIYANECDQDLEVNESSNLQTSFVDFTAKGGVLLRMDGEVSPFQLETGDVVFPACSGGKNRSQTLWGLLRPYEKAISLQLPHATRYGFDSYNGKVNWNRTGHVKKYDEFIKWAGFFKSTKFGWDLFDHWLLKDTATMSELAMMTDYYSTHYYNPNLPVGTRRVYITFAKNAHVHLYRLSQTNSTLTNVFVLFYPIEDLIAKPLLEWETPPRSVKAYRELAAMLEKYLDFSLL